jgi:hypothetical protein
MIQCNPCFYIILFFLSLFFPSCASYKIPTQKFNPSQIKNDLQIQAHQHWLYKAVPRHRSMIQWYDVPHWTSWALFGNDDDGIFGEEPTAKYKTSRNIHFLRSLFWAARNPLHNFTFYVVGTAYIENSTFTLLSLEKNNTHFLKFSPKESSALARTGTNFYLALHGWKPFISLRINYGRQFSFYLGWRPRGNFGIKLLPFAKE